jgi:hypothetical protein
MIQPGFWDGFMVGILTAGFLGLVLRQIQKASLVARSGTQPQRVVHKTDNTPWQILMRAMQAGCQMVLWLGVLVFGIWLFAQLFL